nr:MAG TPA: hypothetical protein [Bacteriophage sp.]
MGLNSTTCSVLGLTPLKTQIRRWCLWHTF